MSKENPVTLKGVEIPQWYLSLESKLLEQMAEFAELDAKLKALRTTIYTMMKDEGIDVIESDQAVVLTRKSAFVDSIDKDRLKIEMPEIYDKYLKKSYRSGGLSVKLKQ